MKQVHYGVADDDKLDEQFAFGKKTYGSEHVDGVIKAQNLAGLADYNNDLKEGKYHSHIREPLGKGFERGYQYPDAVHEEKFQFGVPTLSSENAKDVLYPKDGKM